jgi:hypothetical protein
MSIRRRAWRRPSPALIVASVALFVALGGTSYAVAVGSIGSPQIRDNSVRSVDVRNGTLRSRDLARDSLGGSTIKEEALDASKLDLPPAAPPVVVGIPMQVTVRGDGARFNARGVASVVHEQTGHYDVYANGDMSACVPAATLTEPGEIAAEPNRFGTTAVHVRTAASDGTPADRDFHLIVSC